MDKKQLIEILRDEAMLLEAKAKGAEKAYQLHAVSYFQDICRAHKIVDGTLVQIKCAEYCIKAEISGMPYFNFYSFDEDSSPAYCGYEILKSGKKSKVKTTIFNQKMLIAGMVTVVK
jgi:hypothetical protein